MALNTVFSISESSFKVYAKQFNSLVEFCLYFNLAWSPDIPQIDVTKINTTKFYAFWMLNQILILSKSFHYPHIRARVEHLVFKELSFSYITTKLAGVYFFFFKLLNIRIGDYYSIAEIKSVVQTFHLDTDHWAMYASPMVRSYFLFDMVDLTPEYKCLFLLLLVAH